MGSSDDFDRAMEEVNWAEVYERQRSRGDLTDMYCEILDIGPGDDVVELGSGPGFVTKKLADRVAPGAVYPIDRHQAALVYLADHIDDEKGRIHPIVGDICTPSWYFPDPISIVAAFVFHHLENPARAPSAIVSAVRPRSRVLIVEYHPDAQGAVGPPIEHRISPQECARWLREAGIEIIETTKLPEEKYAILAEIGAE